MFTPGPSTELRDRMTAFTDSGAGPGMTDFGFYRSRIKFGMTDACLHPALREPQGPDDSFYGFRIKFGMTDFGFYRFRNEFGMTDACLQLALRQML